MRGRIDYRACLVRQRIASLMHKVRAMARKPAALPVAFVCGIAAERLHVLDFKFAYGFLAGQVKAMQMVYSLTGSPIR